MKKKIISSIIASLCIALIACLPFLMPKAKTQNLSGNAKYLSNSPIGYYKDTSDEHNHQEVDIILSSIVSGSDFSKQVFLWGGDGSDGTHYDISSVFQVYKDGGVTVSETAVGSDGISYHASPCSSVAETNMQVSSVVKLSNNIIIALYNGYISASAGADYSSLDGQYSSSKNYDKVDNVAMYFFAFNKDDISKSAGQKNTESKQINGFTGKNTVLSYSKEELSNVGADVFEMVFTCFYQLPDPVFLGMHPTSTNYIQIKDPSFTFTTTDTTAPTTAAVEQINTEQYVYTRNVKLSATDADSGVQRIEVSYNDGDYETVKDYTKDLTFSNAADYTAKRDVSETYAIEKNGTYKFRTIDNVGNVSSEVEYTEEGIDRDAPTIEISGLDALSFSVERNFTFAASLIDNNLSPNHFSYKVTLNGAEVTSGEISDDADYTFSVTENGVYTLSVSGVDDVGNRMEDKVYTLVVTDFGIKDCYTSAVIEYDADTQSNGLSAYTFHVDVVYDGGETATFEISNGQNSFTLNRSGLFTVTCKYYATHNGENYYGGSKDVEIDNQFYALTTSAVNGVIDESTTLQRGEHTINFKANDGYSLYTLTINGEVQSGVEADATSFTFNFNGETTVEVVFRKIVELEIESTYTYSHGSLTLNYAVKTDLGEELKAQFSNDLITFAYFESTGAEIENPLIYSYNVGKYKVSYSIDTPLFVGSGEQEIEINPLEINIENIVETYKYTGSAITLVFDEVDENAEVYVKFFRGEDVAEFMDAGEYTYIVTTDNANYSVYAEGSAVILPNIKNVQNTTLVYNGKAQTLDFEFEGTETNVYAKYFLSDEEVTPLVAGTYTVKFYYAPSENVYELDSEKTYTFSISRADVTVAATSLEKVYDGLVPEVSVTVTGFISGFTYDFELSHSLTKNVGEYQIKIVRAEAEEFSNYNLNYADGLVKITPKTVYVKSADGLSKEYGSLEEPEIIAEYVNGVLEGEDLGLRLYREAGEEVGSYDIKAEISNENYVLDFTKTQFIITKRLAIITILDSSKVYGDKTETYNFVRNDTILPADEETVLKSIKRDAGEEVGKYRLYLDTSLLKNYVAVTKEAKFTIEKRQIKVVADGFTGENAVIFGTSEPLTYKVYDAVTNSVMSDIKLEGSLTREDGEDVGTYNIKCGSLSGGKNYEIVSFEGAIYEIAARKLTVKAEASTKVYGDADVFSYTVYDYFTKTALEDIVLSGSLQRDAGEDVGTYQIKLGSLSGGTNYVIASFEGATLEIIKAELTIQIDTKYKGYGEADEPLIPVVIGAKNGDELVVKLIRAEGEELGSYLISIDVDASSDIYKNYNVNFARVYYIIEKKAPNVKLADKTVTYNGKSQSIDALEIPGIDPSDITYVYSYFGQTIDELPVDAGSYSVKAEFGGNENYEAFETEEASLVINQKLVPITIKKLEFVYDGTAKEPEYEIVGLDEEISMIVTYKDDKEPIEVGSYVFTITSNDHNYICNVTMTMKILPAFEKNGSDASVSADSVNFSNSKMEFVEVKDSSLKSIFSSSTDGRRCVSVYSFKNAEAHVGSNEVLKVSIKAKLGQENVELYIVDKDGNVTPVAYELIDGYYVLQINDVTASVLVTVTDRSATYLKILLFALVLLITYLASKNIRKQKRVKFLKKNTSVSGITEKEYVENEQIVESVMVEESDYEIKKLVE